MPALSRIRRPGRRSLPVASAIRGSGATSAVGGAVGTSVVVGAGAGASVASDASALRLHLLRHPTHLHLLDDGGESALHVAARRSDLPMVRELLACGFDVNTRSSSGWTPLEVAQASAGREVVRAVYVAVQADERARWRMYRAHARSST